MSSPDYLEEYNVNTKYNLKIVWRYLKQDKWIISTLLLLVLALELISFSDEFLFKYLVDEATLYQAGKITADLFLSYVLKLMILYLFLKGVMGGVFWFIKSQLFNRLESRLMSNVEKSSFWHILNLSYRFHLNKKTGSIISKLTRGVGKTESLLDAITFQFFPVFFRLILSIGIIFYFDLYTALALLVTVILFLAFGVYVSHKQERPQNMANYKEDLLKQNVSDVFINIETVKYFGKEKRTQGYFNELSHNLKEARVKFWDYFSWYVGLQTLILTLGVAVIVYLSFSSYVEGKITLGSITLIYTAIWKLIPYLYGLMYGYRQFIMSNVDISSLFEIFKEENEVVDKPQAKKIKVKEGNIEFKEVTFSYPLRDHHHGKHSFSIKSLNLKINKNTKLALVGPSGGGKSTVVKLLYRLFDLNQGQILIDGQDISQVTQESLRNSLSIVPQEPILFDNSLFFNVAYANPRASRKEVWQAIKFAHLDKFIEKLPNKEKTIVGERGVKLSGGEKQRVSIARAILANKKILVLDEATSALDSETEKEIQRDLSKLMRNRTTIIIAHRLSTIMKADKIVVLSGGKVIEQGNHNDLINNQTGLYSRLWRLQQGKA